MKQFIILSVVLLFFTACKVEPQKIEFGTDACHYCDMTIVSPQHASQLVTSKGRSYKYDAIECLVHSLQEDFMDVEMAFKEVANFNNPGTYIDAEKARYLVSENLQSPMGENLSAFDGDDAVRKAQEEFSGDTFTWEELQYHLKL